MYQMFRHLFGILPTAVHLSVPAAMFHSAREIVNILTLDISMKLRNRSQSK